MIRSNNIQKIPSSILVQYNNIEYRVLYLFDLDFLLLPNSIFFLENLKIQDYNKGKLVCSETLESVTESNGEAAIDYYELGVWRKVNNVIELKIYGKGIFEVEFGDDVAFVYELIAENQLQQLAIDAIINTSNRYF